MIEFLNTYNDRKEEIQNFIEFMKVLEKLENKKNDNDLVSMFLHSGAMKYQSLINILKSNLSLMLYNIIEFSVSNLLDNLYTEISIKGLTYNDVNEDLKKLWHETQFRGARDPNTSFNTFIDKSKYIVDWIIEKKTLQMNPKNTMPGGNLDSITLKQVFNSHGIKIDTSSPNYRPDIFDNIKSNRNNLAHGSFSFSDALKDSSISDVKRKSDFVLKFLDELIIIVKEYTDKEGYKS